MLQTRRLSKYIQTKYSGKLMKKIIFTAIALVSLLACKQENKPTISEMGNKNQVIEAIMDRRSIRVYKPDQVDQAKLDTIVQCAINAPSALNKQSWEIRVVQNADLLKSINDRFVEDAKGKSLQGSASKAQEPGFSVFHSAPTLIVVARDKDNPYSAADCGMLTQNILLSAQSMNIGTCVIGSVAGILNDNQSKSFREALDIPDNYEVIYGIAVGYKNETPDAKPRDINKVQYIK